MRGRRHACIVFPAKTENFQPLIDLLHRNPVKLTADSQQHYIGRFIKWSNSRNIGPFYSQATELLLTEVCVELSEYQLPTLAIYFGFPFQLPCLPEPPPLILPRNTTRTAQ